MRRNSTNFSQSYKWRILINACLILAITAIISSCVGATAPRNARLNKKNNGSEIQNSEFNDLISQANSKANNSKKKENQDTTKKRIPTLNEQLANLDLENKKTNQKLEVVSNDLSVVRTDIKDIKSDIEDIKNAINHFVNNKPREAKTGIANEKIDSNLNILSIPKEPSTQAINNIMPKAKYVILSDEELDKKAQSKTAAKKQKESAPKQNNKVNTKKTEKPKANYEVAKAEKKVIKQEPQSVIPVGESFKAAIANLNKKNYQEAINNLVEVAKKEKDVNKKTECTYLIGESYYWLKQYNKAVEHFQRVLAAAKSSRQDDAQYMLADAHYKMGQQDKAKQNYSQLISKYPDSAFAPKARKMLQQL